MVGVLGAESRRRLRGRRKVLLTRAELQ
jgi:hypothetical protein